MDTFTNNKIEWTKVKHDVNGNPRYVCHYVNFLTEQDNNSIPLVCETIAQTRDNMIKRYTLALSRAHKLGGKKFHNKQYGGGIVFQSYNLNDLEKDILVLIKKESK